MNFISIFAYLAVMLLSIVPPAIAAEFRPLTIDDLRDVTPGPYTMKMALRCQAAALAMHIARPERAEEMRDIGVSSIVFTNRLIGDNDALFVESQKATDQFLDLYADNVDRTKSYKLLDNDLRVCGVFVSRLQSKGYI